jgi:uncharacterized protein YdaU (DUF1376 family)
LNYVPWHFGDFNNATRHLTRVERSVYRDSIELYYDTEQPLNCVEFDYLAKRLLCQSDVEKQALRDVLREFFIKEGDLYRHERCDAEIAKYHSNTSAKARAGIASAAKRKQKATGVEQALDGCATNQEPRTKNQEPIKEAKASSSIGAYPPEFEKVWEAYPRKAGSSKKDAHKAWSARLKAGATAEGIAYGVARYAAYCKAEGTEERFIKQAVTFFGVGDHYLADWTSSPQASSSKASSYNIGKVDHGKHAVEEPA